MRKYLSLAIFLSILLFVSACSNDDDQVTPEERLDEYVNKWNEQNFSEMYEKLSTDSQDNYSTEQFIDRYQKIYGDLEVSNLAVSYDVPEQDSDDENEEEQTSKSFPIQVEMETFAGPISFEEEITMVQQQVGEQEDEEFDWFVSWDPGYIFPELRDGGEIAFDYENPVRGQIYDRNENGLAINESILEFGVVPEEFGDDAEETKQQIADLLQMDKESVDAALNANWVEPHLYVPLKKMPNIDEQLVDNLREFDAIRSKEVTGRIYPYGEATAHIVGYLGKITAEDMEEVDSSNYSANDLIGQSGIESRLEERLKGERGIKIVVREDDKDDIVLVETPVKHGENVVLTIDANLQQTIYDAYDGDAGTTAAIHPKTGETLALVNSPAFDPNRLTYGISSQAWEDLQSDPQSPLLNRFIATYSPGSTIKPLTSAIGLQLGAITPEGTLEIDDLTWSKEGWGNYQVRRVSESTGPVDVTDALIRSDNIFFARKALEIGNEALIAGLSDFGFGQELPINYPVQQSNVSVSGEIDREILLADTGYGQGEMEMSALHLATAYTAFLNDGNMLQPTIEKGEQTAQVWKEDLVTTEQATLIQDALKRVVTDPNGTANNANNSSVPLSGKTGTAELKASQDEEDGQENGWFVAYPDDQEILIAMMVEHTEDRGGSHYVVDKVVDIFNNLN